MYHFASLETVSEIWIEKGNKFLPIHELVRCLSRKYKTDQMKLAGTLLCTYVFSGCDSVSYPYRRGKKRGAQVRLKLVDHFNKICEFGDKDCMTVNEDIISEARLYFVALYGYNEFGSLDSLREYMFATTKSDLRMLPPTEDAFYFHVLPNLYQFVIFKRAILCDLHMPEATEFGYRISNGKLVSVMMKKSAKPDVAKIVSCKCKTSQCLPRCSCAKAEVPCCTACSCLGQKGKCGGLFEESDSDEDSSSYED